MRVKQTRSRAGSASAKGTARTDSQIFKPDHSSHVMPIISAPRICLATGVLATFFHHSVRRPSSTHYFYHVPFHRLQRSRPDFTHTRDYSLAQNILAFWRFGFPKALVVSSPIYLSLSQTDPKSLEQSMVGGLPSRDYIIFIQRSSPSSSSAEGFFSQSLSTVHARIGGSARQVRLINPF